MKTRNYWILIEKLYEFSNQSQRLGLYECGICHRRYKVRIASVENDRSHMCKSCACQRRRRHTWKVTLPSGVVMHVKGLHKWADARKLPYTSLYRSYQTGKPTRAGYLVEKITDC